MDVGLGIAGLLCVALGFGHETVGQVWVLPTFSKERLSGTRLGPSSMTEGMVRVTWHIVTIFALAVGGVLLTLAWDEGADPKILLLRWFAVMWLAATAMAAWVTRPHLRFSPLLPVPMLWVVIAVLCWTAST
jgi:hypothetical protein